MAKFNVVQKRIRAQTQERKRATKGDSVTHKIRTKPQPLSISAKRQRKLDKKRKRERKEALKKGLMTMEDVEMLAAEGTPVGANQTPAKFSVKKSVKVKQLKRKGKKNKAKSKSDPKPSGDAMVE